MLEGSPGVVGGGEVVLVPLVEEAPVLEGSPGDGVGDGRARMFFDEVENGVFVERGSSCVLAGRTEEVAMVVLNAPPSVGWVGTELWLSGLLAV